MQLVAGNFKVSGRWFAVWFTEVFQKAYPKEFPNPLNWEAFLTVIKRLDKLTGKKAITLAEFVSHFAVIYNETGGTFLPVTELGSDAYFFEQRKLRVGTKMSYNQSPNRRAGDQLLAWRIIVGKADVAAWNSTILYPKSQPANVRAMARNCDFYKFRGRGLNQLTWLDNYLRVFNPATGLDCRTMTNAQLDKAFQDPDVYTAVFRQFNASLPLASAIKEAALGKFWLYGKRVSGGNAYADKFTRRCNLLLAALTQTKLEL